MPLQSNDSVFTTAKARFPSNVKKAIRAKSEFFKEELMKGAKRSGEPEEATRRKGKQRTTTVDIKSSNTQL